MPTRIQPEESQKKEHPKKKTHASQEKFRTLHHSTRPKGDWAL
jgi:hypothetical protein